MTCTNVLKALLILAATTLAACGDPDPSTDIPTERIYARFVAETGADGTSTVTADFFEKQDWFLYEGVYLAGGDTLDVRTHERNLLFTGGGSHFEGQFVSGILEDTEFQFDLQRARGDFRDAPDSWGTLPAPMDLWTPQDGAQYSMANDAFVIGWTPAGTLDDMRLEGEARCQQPYDPDSPFLNEEFTVNFTGDTGLETVDFADALVFEGDCTRYAVTLKLVRARAGNLDDAYKPDEAACADGNGSRDCDQLGSVSVRQARSVAIVLTP